MDYNIEIIHESLVNGQRKQMVKQIDAYGIEFWNDFAVYLSYISTGTMHTAYEAFTDTTISYFKIKNN